MKRCPYCAEEIQEEAIKCRYCGELLVKQPPVKWYFKTSILIIALLSLGPLALPLVWFNPRFARKTKILVSVTVLVLTYYLTICFIHALKVITTYYRLIF